MSKIPDHWKEWINHNFDRLADKSQIVMTLKKEFKLSDCEIDECFLEAEISYNCYANFIATIKADFNDPVQMNANLENLRNFLTIEKGNTSPEIILDRIRTQLISLDRSCLDFKIRAKKIAFFNALDTLIARDNYDFLYPDPIKFEFFPIKNNLCDFCDDDLKSFEKHKTTNLELHPLTKINNNVLYVIKNDKNLSVLGNGGYGKVYKGFYQEKLIAIKYINLSEYEYKLRWKCIVIYYRQSLVVLERTFDNVIPMNDIFFYQEKSIFDDNGNYSIIATYPLCKNNFLDIIKEEAILNDYQSFKPIKDLLKTINNLHQNEICINDLSSSNILFDYFGNIFLNDFDFWLPKQMSNAKSIYISGISIADVPCGLSEISFIENQDLSLIVPDKLDIWCFGAIILDGLGYSNKVTKLSWMKTSMHKYVRMDRSNTAFKKKMKELKICAEDMVSFVKENLNERISRESDMLKKKFLEDTREVLLACLQHNCKDRPSAKELLSYNLFLMCDS